MTLQTLQSFFGWCLAINLTVYVIWMGQALFNRRWLIDKHSRWFGLDPDQMPIVLYQFLGLCKLLIILFNFAPWLALMIMNSQ